MNITFPSGEVRQFDEGTTGMQIAEAISPGLARMALAIFVNDEPYDLSRPITTDATIRIVTFNDEDGKEVFWHSSAHLMAEAVQELWPGTKFTIGPPIEHGYYYDVVPPEGVSISSDDFPKIEKKMKELAKAANTYDRRVVDFDEAMDYYTSTEDNAFKRELIEGLKGSEITFYTQGNFTDLCRGVHVPSTSYLKYPKVLSVAGAYWRGDSTQPMLTRLYGITFPKKQMLDDFLEMRAEAERRDHRKLGKELGLFMISPKIGGGLPVWLPKGTVVRRRLEDFMRQQQVKRGYKEVITPHIGSLDLYRTSGHYPYYKDSQYTPMDVDDEEYMLKPMNCPHHHSVYANTPKSYRDLPYRLAEFGTVYRYEQSGELNGLSRVRGFTQDDAHIYCTDDQLKDEIKDVIDLTQHVFSTFDMEVQIRLSFRDDNADKYGGALELWERAQREIKEVADELELDYTIAEGEAAFYGPKIDFVVKDAIGRKWQLGTVQVDYVMPERFELEYTGSDNAKHRPVIIHRAPFGSLERFFSILIEHFAGNFPFWLAPEQVSVLPIASVHEEYATDLAEKLKALGYRVNLDVRNEKISRKIAESEQQKVPYALIIGDREMEANSVAVREHGVGDKGAMPIADVMELFATLNDVE